MIFGKTKDLEKIGKVHDSIQQASFNLGEVEVCKLDYKSRQYRILAREHFKRGRLQLRHLRDHVKKLEKIKRIPNSGVRIERIWGDDIDVFS